MRTNPASGRFKQDRYGICERPHRGPGPQPQAITVIPGKASSLQSLHAAFDAGLDLRMGLDVLDHHI